MIHERLLEHILRHVDILDTAVERGVDWSDILQVYSVLHALQVHAQAIIDYLLHTCAALKISAETPIRCIEELESRGMIRSGEADELKKLVRFRNVVVHGYSSIDIGRVRNVLESRGYRRVSKYIVELHRLLEKEGAKDP